MCLHERKAQLADYLLILFVERRAFPTVDHRPEQMHTRKTHGTVLHQRKVKRPGERQRTFHDDLISLHRYEQPVERREAADDALGVDRARQVVEDD